jgi:cytosine deaminase
MLLHGATLDDGTRADVRVEGELIAAVAPVLDPVAGELTVDLTGYVLLPAPAEPHAHLDKALTADRVPNPSGDLLGAIVAWRAHRPTLTLDDIAGRAERAVRMLVANGVTAVRTHVDVADDIGTLGIEALVKAREVVGHLADIQIVALVSPPISGPDGGPNRAALGAAMAAGADLVGGVPHLEPDPRAAMAHVLEVAVATGRDVDLHMDETLDPGVLHLAELARMVDGFPHRVTASHCCSLGMQPTEVQADVSAAVAAAGIAVVTLPQTNLFLQARGWATAPPRGLTAVRVLLDAGVTVAAGADNLQDPFNLVGRADPLETSALLVMAAHLTPAESFHAVTGASRAALGLTPVSITPGSPAELVAVPRAATVREAMATAAEGRVVVHRGQRVAA